MSISLVQEFRLIDRHRSLEDDLGKRNGVNRAERLLKDLLLSLDLSSCRLLSYGHSVSLRIST
jgi:hypothetical protein